MEKKSLKQKIRDNADMILIGAVYAGAVAGTVVLMRAALKNIAQSQAALEEAIARGDMVLPNADGSFWIVSQNR